MKKMKKLILALSIIGLLTSNSHAEMQSWYSDIFLGLNTKSSERLLKDVESPDNKNYNLDNTGALQERELFGKYNTTSGALGSNPVTLLTKLYKSDGTKYFVAAADSKIAYGSSGNWTDITNTGGISSTTAYWSGSVLNDSLILFNKDNLPQYWDGVIANTTSLIGGNAPGTNCSLSAVHKNRMWAANSITYPSRLYYSSLNDADDWATTGGYIDVFVNDGDVITGLAVLGPHLYVFKQFAIYQIYGATPNEFAVYKTNSEVGCIAPNSIQITDSGVIFLSRTGVYLFNGSNSIVLSDKIEPTINSISSTYIKNSTGLYDKQNHYWLSYTSQNGTYNDSVILYNTLLKEWYEYDGLNFNVFFKADGGNDKGELYAGSSLNNGIVYQLQSAAGSETVRHSLLNQFNTGVTDNVVISGTQTSPTLELKGDIDTYDKIMLHFNEAPDSTSTDDDAGGNIITFEGNAEVNYVDGTFNMGSLLLDGDGDYITTSNSDDFNFDDDWTIEFRVYFDDVTTDHRGFFQMTSGTHDGYSSYWHKDLQQLIFLSKVSGNVKEQTFNWIPVINTWYHIEFSYSSTDSLLYCFIDGDLQGTKDISVPQDSTGSLDIGRGRKYQNNEWIAGYFYHDGYMDEFRLSKGAARYTSVFTIPTSEYTRFSEHGFINSDNLQINASGLAALGIMSWTVTDTDSDTNIKFQTRTGATDSTASSDYNLWENWASESTVQIVSCNSTASLWDTSNNDYINRYNSFDATISSIDVLYFEDEDEAIPQALEIYINDPDAYENYVETSFDAVDLTDCEFLTGWLNSREITGDIVSILVSASDNYVDANYVTLNTIEATDTWIKWYYDLSTISSIDLASISDIRVKYIGPSLGSVTQGTIWLDNIYAENYFDSGDICTSTPNDWVQYRGIFGTSNKLKTPTLTAWQLEYTPASSSTESSLDYEYKTNHAKFEDNGRVNKQFSDYLIWFESDDQIVQTVDYSIDYGEKTGSFTIPVTTTGRTVAYKKFFPASTWGKTIQRTFKRDDATSSSVTIKAEELRYISEPLGSD